MTCAITKTSVQQAWHGDTFELIRRLRSMSQDIFFHLCHELHFTVIEATYMVRNQHSYAVRTSLMGLVGHHGVLPTYYQTRLIEAAHEKKTALSEFIQMFQNRLVHLYYQAWQYARPILSYHFSGVSQKPCTLDHLLSTVAGIQSPDSLPDIALLQYTGLLCRRPLARLSMESILRGYFSLPIRIAAFQLGQLVLSHNERTCIGLHGRHHQLGKSAFLGATVFTRQSLCTVFIGPLNEKQFTNLLPNTPMFGAVKRVIQYLIPTTVQACVHCILHYATVPWWQLDTQHYFQLGFNIWCRSQPFSEDVMVKVIDVI